MMKSKKIVFDLYRYQILPIDRRYQERLFEMSLEEVLMKKNEFFFDALRSVQKYILPKVNIRHVVVDEGFDYMFFRFAINRSLTRETKYFKEEQIENWPSFFVFVWNHPERQYIAVQVKRNAFQDTAAVARILVNGINKFLHKQFLRTHFEPLFNDYAFWEIVESNEGKIKDIVFDVVTPNMSNISKSLSEQLKTFAINTNTVTTKIALKADDESSIIADPSNEQLTALVEYTSQGGGSISMRIRGFRKRQYVSEAKKQIEFDELDINGENSGEIVEILKELLL